MGRIFDEMSAFFERQGWQTIPGRAENSRIMGLQGKNGRWTCVALAMDEQEQFIFYSLCPVKAPPERLAEMAELLHRANYGLHVGNFELDFSDGEIRYKTSIDVEGTTLSFELARNVINANMAHMDKYLPGILALIQEQLSPTAALAKVEG